MDITRDNFAATLECVRAAICRSSFLALDCEFSGLSTGGSTSQYDSPEERYVTLRRTASGFLVIQFGLAAFTLDKDNNRYTQETFNFYLFPRHRSQGSFLCQPSSLEFLIENGFDFNRMIRDVIHASPGTAADAPFQSPHPSSAAEPFPLSEISVQQLGTPSSPSSRQTESAVRVPSAAGIPYLRPAQVETLRDQLEKQLAESSPSTATTTSPAAAGPGGTPVTGAQPTPVPENQTEFVDKAISEISKFLEGTEDHLDFHRLSPFQRKLLYDHVPHRIGTPLELETVRTSGPQRALRVSRALSGEERAVRARRRLEQRVDEAAGFAQVIKAVSESGKPVVGHNMLLDLIHIIEQFICPLPETYADFKSVVHAVFPTLVDTKVMGSTAPFRDLIPATSLGEMTSCLAIHPFSMPEIVPAEDSTGTVYGLKDSKHHEAGYDAFLTAACFAAMISYLGLLLKPPQPLLEPTAEIVRPFANKIFAQRMADLPYLNLTGEDLTPSRDHVFYLTFPAQWKTSDIIQLFSPFSRVHVAWLDDTSAFVSLDRRDQASQVLQNVRASGLFTLCTYREWQTRQRMSSAKPKSSASSDSPASERPVRASPAATASPSLATPPAGGTARTTPRSTGSDSKTEDSPASTGKQRASKETADKAGDGTPNSHSRSSGKKRKRESSGSSENGVEQQTDATKANTDLFAVPDW